MAADVVRRLLAAEVSLSPTDTELTVPLVDANHAADVLIALREHRVPITGAAVTKPSLDEVFLTLTGHPADPGTPETDPIPQEATR